MQWDGDEHEAVLGFRGARALTLTNLFYDPENRKGEQTENISLKTLYGFL